MPLAARAFKLRSKRMNLGMENSSVPGLPRKKEDAMASWLAVGPPENWEISLEKGVWGIPPTYEKAWGRVAPGDTVFFYATAPVKGVIGYGEIRATKRESTPLWPQEVKEGRALWPLRVELEVKASLPRQQWEYRRVTVQRRGLVLQRAFQRLTDARAQELLEALTSSSGGLGI
jgi:hypothetical protein